MSKLGKKARKFAKKNLQSVDKQRRLKQKASTFKRKAPRGGKGDVGKGNTAEDKVGSTAEPSIRRDYEEVVFGDTALDAIFSDNDSDSREDASDSDGFLSENSNCEYADGSESESDSDKNEGNVLLGQNKEMQIELAKQNKKLDNLRKKDPGFLKFLESHNMNNQRHRSEETSSDEEGETGDQRMVTADDDSSNLNKDKVLTSSTIDAWCQLVMEEKSVSALPNLLNAYRAACHYGSDGALSYQRFQKSETFCKILKFMLNEADNIFRRLLGVSSSSNNKENILELKNTSKWKNVKPMIKSYLRSTLFLLNQVSDSQILAFALTQLKASTIFFAAFPSLLQRLIKVAVHLWATGGGMVSTSSFLIIRHVALLLSPNCLDTCLIKAYKAFIAHCKFVESTNLVHIRFLVDSLVELYSIDVQKSSAKVLLSIQQLAKILQQGLKSKKKETLKKIYNWQYTNCMELWVKFISANIKENDLQSLLYLMIQIISGVANLFPGPRHLPLRIKCIQMLNQLSSASRIFIPITSLTLDSLEYRGSGKPGARTGKALDIATLLKVPKQCVKSHYFQEECVLSAIEMLTMHFAQWSYHLSFPELATIPLVRLKKFHEQLSADSLQRPVKRLIDQVEKNVEFVNKKRDEVAFSPKDQDSVDAFLQVNACNSNTPFTQYYTGILKNKLSRNVATKISESTTKKSRKRKNPGKTESNEIKDIEDSRQDKLDSEVDGKTESMEINDIEDSRQEKLDSKVDGKTESKEIKDVEDSREEKLDSKVDGKKKDRKGKKPRT